MSPRRNHDFVGNISEKNLDEKRQVKARTRGSFYTRCFVFFLKKNFARWPVLMRVFDLKLMFFFKKNNNDYFIYKLSKKKTALIEN